MGLALTDQIFTSVNEYATLDGAVYFFSFEFTKLLTLFKDHLRLLQTFEGLLFGECLFFDQIKVNYLNLHFQKQII